MRKQPESYRTSLFSIRLGPCVSKLLLGLDVGGSLSRATVASFDGQESIQILGRGEAGPGNPLAVGLDSAVQAMTAAIRAAERDAGLHDHVIAEAVIAVAGCSDSSMLQKISQWARSAKIADHITFVTDAEPLLSFGDQESCVLAAISGTGSIILGRDQSGKIYRAGGHGYLLGDDGSGFDISRRALRLILDRGDQESVSRLRDSALEHFLAAGVDALPSVVHQHDHPREKIAAFAKTVCLLASKQDSEALAIVHDAVDALASDAISIAEQLNTASAPLHLVLTGGVLLGSETYRNKFLRSLEEAGIALADTVLVHDVTEPALRMAAKKLSANSPDLGK